jgi:hypothetical protein
MAASEEIARLANVYQQNQMVIRQGTKMNTIIYEADRNLILLFMVPARFPWGGCATWFVKLLRKYKKFGKNRKASERASL